MIEKLRNTIKNNGPAGITIALLLIIWESVSLCGLVPAFMLPSPVSVVKALVLDAGLLTKHAGVTLAEAFIGLTLGVLFGCICAIVMDNFEWIYKALYPILVITQTIPTVAIAPLLVLWFGYEMTPKIILIIIVTFFPVTVGLLDGFHAVDKDSIQLLQSMGAKRWQVFFYIKWPSARPQLFAALKIAAAYSVVGAVIAEWLGGFNGLGVYMIRVKKAFAFDKMFAVIFLISIVSLLLMKLVEIAQRKCMPYLYTEEKEEKTEKGKK